MLCGEKLAAERNILRRGRYYYCMELGKTFYPKSRQVWRLWLGKNHLKEKKIAVIRYKNHTGKPSPTYQELLHEAICFGWIDTTVKRIDDECYAIRFTQRTDKGKWSDNTLSYGKKLLAEGRMSPHGIKRYQEGLSRPTHDAGVAKNPEMPPDLEKELRKDKMAHQRFLAFAPSYKRMYFRWIERAKRPETRTKRVGAVVQRAKENNKKFG